MSENQFYKKLKQKRQELGYNLEQISENTKIDIKFLRAIEEGDFEILPSTYIKLFLKSYAEELGINAQEILEQFDKYKFTAGLDEKPQKPEQSSDTTVNKLSITPGTNKKNLTTIAIIIVVFFVIIFFLKKAINSGGGQESDTMPLNVSEIPIEEEKVDTTREEEAEKSTPRDLPDTIITENQEETSETISSDSLLLEATFQDTCWMNVIIDNSDTLDAIYIEDNQEEWLAANNFVIKIGKPEAIESLNLNGRDLGPVGNDTPVILFINKSGIYRRTTLE
ncbi:MAG TPA: helix-turn-helix transcriptional regulator [bacterium]|nr:helix-turn-helix transcriptional regulator [bacterium]